MDRPRLLQTKKTIYVVTTLAVTSLLEIKLARELDTKKSESK